VAVGRQCTHPFDSPSITNNKPFYRVHRCSSPALRRIRVSFRPPFPRSDKAIYARMKFKITTIQYCIEPGRSLAARSHTRQMEASVPSCPREIKIIRSLKEERRCGICWRHNQTRLPAVAIGKKGRPKRRSTTKDTRSRRGFTHNAGGFHKEPSSCLHAFVVLSAFLFTHPSIRRSKDTEAPQRTRGHEGVLFHSFSVKGVRR
jgi:hypothetical protein